MADRERGLHMVKVEKGEPVSTTKVTTEKEAIHISEFAEETYAPYKPEHFHHSAQRGCIVNNAICRKYIDAPIIP